MTYRFLQLLVRILFQLFAPVKVQGLENLPASGGYIATSNHLGRLDPFLVYYLLDRRDIIMLAAEKYRKYALARWMARIVDAIWVDRFNADMPALRETLERLRQGGVLAIAPEGTRSRAGTLIEGRLGASFLAAKTGLPVVPVAIVGTQDKAVLEKLRRLQRPHITVRIGQPYTFPPLQGKDRQVVLAAYTDEIMCRIAALLPTAYHGVYADHPRMRALLGQAQPAQVLLE